MTLNQTSLKRHDLLRQFFFLFTVVLRLYSFSSVAYVWYTLHIFDSNMMGEWNQQRKKNRKKECKLVARHSMAMSMLNNLTLFISLHFSSAHSSVGLCILVGNKEQGNQPCMQCTMMIESFLVEKYDANGRRMQNRSQRFCVLFDTMMMSTTNVERRTTTSMCLAMCEDRKLTFAKFWFHCQISERVLFHLLLFLLLFHCGSSIPKEVQFWPHDSWSFWTHCIFSIIIIYYYYHWMCWIEGDYYYLSISSDSVSNIGFWYVIQSHYSARNHLRFIMDISYTMHIDTMKKW